MNNIFGRFPNGMAEIILEIAWSNFGRIGGCLAHEMMGLGAKPGFKNLFIIICGKGRACLKFLEISGLH